MPMKIIMKLCSKFRSNASIAKIKKGSNVQIMDGFICSSPEKIEIENDVYIGPAAKFWAEGGIRIYSGAIIGPECTIYTSNHNYDSLDLQALPYDGRTIMKQVKIFDNVWIGGNVIIVGGTEIGEGAVVAAGSIVSKNVPPFAVVGGNPVNIIKYRNKEIYAKLKAENKIYLKLKKFGKIKYEKSNIT
ncbi:MAG: acyltransferase [Candidatus Omnitrophota bacterium]